MKYFLISVEWDKLNSEPICVCDNEEKGKVWAGKKLRERGFFNKKLKSDEYDDPSVIMAGILPL
jgi:hypothetical protein